MKARVKATDRIIEVMCVMNIEGVAVWEDISGISTTPNQYTSDELEFLDFPEMPIETYTPDYWTRLEHQAAIAAMQGLMSYIEQITPKEGRSFRDEIVGISVIIAHALVVKIKEKEEMK